METSPLDFAIALARQVGASLLDRFRLANFQSRYKADHSIVTEADVEADRQIAAAIQAAYPEELLISEELRTSIPIGNGHNQAAWVVDPIDGTTNFSLGLPIWGVLIARLVDGWPSTGVLYFPALDELYSAQHGQGAFLNGAPIQVQPPNPQRPSTFFTCCARTFRRYHVGIPYKARILGSAGYSLCSVARGIAVVGFEATPKIWDIAAGWVLVEEAGGVVETLEEECPFPLRAGVDYSPLIFPTLASATRPVQDRSRQQITPRQMG